MLVMEVWGCREKGFLVSEQYIGYKKYLEAVAIPRAIGSRNLSLSSVACTKFAPTRPVTTTTAAVRDGLAPKDRKVKFSKMELKYNQNTI